MTIYNQSGAAVFNLDSIVSDLEIEPSDASQFVRCSVSKLPLKPGEYRLAVAARSADGRHDHIPNALRFSVVAADFFDGRRTNDKQSAGLVYVEHSWHNVG